MLHGLGNHRGPTSLIYTETRTEKSMWRHASGVRRWESSVEGGAGNQLAPRDSRTAVLRLLPVVVLFTSPDGGRLDQRRNFMSTARLVHFKGLVVQILQCHTALRYGLMRATVIQSTRQ